MNLKHFPVEVIEPFGIEARHPDEFILHLLNLAPDQEVKAAEDHRVRLKHPPKTVGIAVQAIGNP